MSMYILHIVTIIGVCNYTKCFESSMQNIVFIESFACNFPNFFTSTFY